MAEFSEENKQNGVFGGISFEGESNQENQSTTFKKVTAESLPTKPSMWSKIRSFLFQEIDWNAPVKIKLTPYQKKIEDEINDFLHQEISFKGFWDLITK